MAFHRYLHPIQLTKCLRTFIRIDATSDVLYSSSKFEDFKTPKECNTFRIVYGQTGVFKLVKGVSHIAYQS